MESNQKNIKQCEFCQIEATSLCLECNNYYCDSCYKISHDKEEYSKHKKEKIDYFVPIDTKCQDHPKYPMHLFCCDEKGRSSYNLIRLSFFFYRIMLCILSLS